MADALVEAGDVETALVRSLTNAEQERIEALCVQVSNRLRARMPFVDDQIQSGTIDPGVVSAVLAGVIARFLSNPAGASSISEVVSIFSKTSSWSAGRPLGLVILDSDLEQIVPGFATGFVQPGTIWTRPQIGVSNGWPC